MNDAVFTDLNTEGGSAYHVRSEQVVTYYNYSTNLGYTETAVHLIACARCGDAMVSQLGGNTDANDAMEVCGDCIYQLYAEKKVV